MMLDVGCWMFDVGCWMFDAGCWMFEQNNRHKYLAIYFQVFAYEEPQMNADKRRCLSAADSSAFIRVHPRFVKAVFTSFLITNG